MMSSTDVVIKQFINERINEEEVHVFLFLKILHYRKYMSNVTGR